MWLYADVGHTIDCVVTAHNAAGNSAPVESNVTAAVTSGSGVTWPASYLTGPLGATNNLPAVRNGVLLGIWGGVAGNSSAQQRAFIQPRATDIGRWPDIVGFAADGSASPGSAQLDVSGSDLSETWIHSNRAIRG